MDLVCIIENKLTEQHILNVDELIYTRFKENKSKETVAGLVASYVLLQEYYKRYNRMNNEYAEFIRDVVLERHVEMALYRKYDLLEYKLFKGRALKFCLHEVGQDSELVQMLIDWKKRENHKTVRELLDSIEYVVRR